MENEIVKREAEAVKEMRSLFDKAQVENREMTEEEQAKFDALDAEIAKLQKRQAAAKKLSGLESSLEQPTSKAAESKVEVIRDTEHLGETQKQQRRAAFCKYLIGAPLTNSETRALEVGTAGEGGNLVPTDFSKSLEVRIQQLNPFRSIGREINLTRAMDLPVHTTRSAAAVRGEEADVSSSVTDPAFAKETLNYWEIYHEVLYSRELRMQSAIDLEAFLLEEMAQAIAYKEENLFVTGAGTTEPTGLDTIATIGGVSVGNVAQGTTAVVTLAELINIYHTMKPSHRRFAKWVMSDATAKYLLNLLEVTTTTVGTPTNTYKYDYYTRILEKDLREAPGTRLLGNDIIITDHIADLGGDNVKSIVLFDPRYMVIANFGGIQVETDFRDLAIARTGQKAIVMYRGVDMKFNNPDALVGMTNVNI